MGVKIYFQKTFKKACQKQKILLLLHPLRETRIVIIETRKKEDYVPRHIELTAVLTEMLEQKNKE